MEFELRGGVAEIAEIIERGTDDPRGLLVEGGAGTGKTFAMQAVMHTDCIRNPGARWIMARKTRSSMTTTVLEEPWEQFVIKDSLERGSVRIEGGTQRKAYRYSNGSSVYPIGIDDVSKVMSGGFRGICIHEVTGAQGAGAEGITEKQYMYLLTRLGRRAHGYLLLDCNPSAEDHWCNSWAEKGKLRRFYSRHHHNPLYATAETVNGKTHYTWTERGRAYIRNLQQLVGPARARLLLHKWVSASGLVWPEWDPACHVIPRKRFQEVPKARWKACWMSWDWGWSAPGCLQFWAWDGAQAYRVWEIMWRRQHLTWWAEKVSELARWGKENLGLSPVTVECSHEKPDGIELFNISLEKHGYPAVARKADVSVVAGIDVVRQWLRPTQDGLSSTALFVEDAAFLGIDQAMREDGMATSTEAQIASYVLAEQKDGKPIPEMPDPACRDDGCLIAGTLVLTRRGWVPIEAIQEGDRIPTPWGGGWVEATGLTGTDRALWRVETASGRVLVGTRNHKVWANGNLVRLDAVRYADIMAAWGTSPRSSTEGVDGVLTARGTSELGTGVAERGVRTNSCTDAFGRMSAGQFPRERSFTIATATRRTTALRTWSAYPHRITPESTDSASGHAKGRVSGTDPRLGERGTQSTPGRLGSDTSTCLSGPASSAGASTSRSGLARGSARTHVSRPIVVPAEWITRSAPARDAALRSLQAGTASSAAVDVVVSSGPAGAGDVYNLNVEPWHVYFANGLLVRNCDSTRYALVWAHKQFRAVDDVNVRDLPPDPRSWEARAAAERAIEEADLMRKRGEWR